MSSVTFTAAHLDINVKYLWRYDPPYGAIQISLLLLLLHAGGRGPSAHRIVRFGASGE